MPQPQWHFPERKKHSSHPEPFAKKTSPNQTYHYCGTIKIWMDMEPDEKSMIRVRHLREMIIP